MAENNNALNVNERYEQPFDLSSVLWNRFNDLKREINVQKPCKVVAVDYVSNSVDVKILDLDVDGNGARVEYPIIPDVPIRQPLTSGSAFIILPVQIGDIGTIEFFDSSVDDIITQDEYSYTLEEEWHSLSDGLFTNGFMPKSKVIPIDYTKPLTIGLKNLLFSLTVDSLGNLNILAPIISMTATTAINMTAPIVNLTGAINVTGEVTGSGIDLSTHTHPYTDDGSPMNTGAPN